MASGSTIEFAIMHFQMDQPQISSLILDEVLNLRQCILVQVGFKERIHKHLINVAWEWYGMISYS